MAASIPKEMYVSIQFSKAAANSSGHIGYVSPYTKDAAFRQRKARQDIWAYGSKAEFVINDDGEIELGANNTADLTEAFMLNCYPKIYKNEPIDGFEIAKSVRFGSWAGRGNGNEVVWRLTDPRGFDVTINSENFAQIVNCTTIINGVIQGKCVWGRDGATNILLPESSDPFKAAYQLTKLVDEKLSIRDVTRGDLVRLIMKSQNYPSGFFDATYLGRMSVVNSTMSVAKRITWNLTGGKSTPFHMFSFVNEKGVTIVLPLASVSVGEILQKGASTKTEAECIEEVNGAIHNGRSDCKFIDAAMAVVSKVSEVSELTIELNDYRIEITADAGFKNDADSRYSWAKQAELFVAQSSTNSKWYIGHNFRASSNGLPQPVLFEVDYDEVVNLGIISVPATEAKDRWSRNTVKAVSATVPIESLMNAKSISIKSKTHTTRIVGAMQAFAYQLDTAR